VWKWISLSLGFCSFFANFVFCLQKFQRWLFRFVLLKIYSLFFGSAFSMFISFCDIRISLGSPCFSARHLIVDFLMSISVHLQFHNSPILKPVSFSANNVVEIFLVHPFISASTSFSVGTNGNDGLFL